MSELNNLEPNNFEKNNTELNNTQVNNSEFIKDNTPKKSSNRMLVWFLVVFTILAMLVTALLIYLTNNSESFGDKNLSKNENNNDVQGNVQNNDEKEDIKDEANLAVKLTDTYHNNPIEFESYFYFDGKTKTREEYYQDGDNQEEHQKQYEYIQIKGLKNKEVENKINKEIMEVAKELSEKCEVVETTIGANYANVFSISITGQNTEEIADYDNAQTLNYRLDTGEQIQFEDLFTNKAYIRTILTQAAYEQYMKQYDQFADLNKIDYSKVETSTFEIVNNYMNGAKKIFAFSHNKIDVIIGNDIIQINMPDFYENIAIYKRYLSNDNLYENDKQSQEMFVFSERYFDYSFYHKVEELQENLYVDIALYDHSDDKNEDKQNTSVEEMENLLKKVKNLASENQDKAYIFYYKDELWNDEEYTIHPARSYLCTMEKEYYKQHGKEIIARGNREYRESEGVVMYEDDNILRYEFQDGEFVLVQEVE